MRWLEKFDVRLWGVSQKFKVVALYCAGAYASIGKVWRPGIGINYTRRQASSVGVGCPE